MMLNLVLISKCSQEKKRKKLKKLMINQSLFQMNKNIILNHFNNIFYNSIIIQLEVKLKIKHIFLQFS